MEEYFALYQKYSAYTMIAPDSYVRNLLIVELFQEIEGAVVECGTWRGGMIAGIAELLQGERAYYLFDSFEGLPSAQKIDGDAAVAWQNNKDSPIYYDNCTADEASARAVMKLSGAKNYFIVKGWFNQTLSTFDKNQKIAILRLDGDWYDSTIECLKHLYSQVVDGGIIIIDDYYTWDGCTRAVHHFFSECKISDRIRQFDNDVCFIVKGWSNRT